MYVYVRYICIDIYKKRTYIYKHIRTQLPPWAWPLEKRLAAARSTTGQKRDGLSAACVDGLKKTCWRSSSITIINDSGWQIPNIPSPSSMPIEVHISTLSLMTLTTNGLTTTLSLGGYVTCTLAIVDQNHGKPSPRMNHGHQQLQAVPNHNEAVWTLAVWNLHGYDDQIVTFSWDPSWFFLAAPWNSQPIPSQRLGFPLYEIPTAAGDQSPINTLHLKQ